MRTISIIIPCHNSEEFIKPLLLSFQALNLKDIGAEFIFVLDSCTDSTELMIIEYMKGLNYKIVEANVRAPGLARNIGMDTARGEYIWFVDSDDWIINPEVLQQVLPALELSQSGMAKIKFVSNFFSQEHYSMVWQYFFKSSILKKVRFNDKQNFEDNDFTKEILFINNQKNIPYLQIPSYFYNYCRPGSQTTKLRKSEN